MPPSVEDRLRDIVESITKIEKLNQGQSLDQFAADEVRRMATERYLEIVCEASRKLPDDTKLEAKNIDWRRMLDFGNRLRHAYHATDVGIVWDILQNHLPLLKSFAASRIDAARR